MRVVAQLTSFATALSFVAADPLVCTFRSPTSPVHLSITDNAVHSKGLGTRVRTCDKTTCGDDQGMHKFVDCKGDLNIGAETDVYVDDDLV